MSESLEQSPGLRADMLSGWFPRRSYNGSIKEPPQDPSMGSEALGTQRPPADSAVGAWISKGTHLAAPQPHQREEEKDGQGLRRNLRNLSKKKVRIGLSCQDFLLGRLGRLTKESYLRLGLASPFITTSKALIALRRKSQLLNWAWWASPSPSLASKCLTGEGWTWRLGKILVPAFQELTELQEGEKNKWQLGYREGLVRPVRAQRWEERSGQTLVMGKGWLQRTLKTSTTEEQLTLQKTGLGEISGLAWRMARPFW